VLSKQQALDLLKESNIFNYETVSDRLNSFLLTIFVENKPINHTDLVTIIRAIVNNKPVVIYLRPLISFEYGDEEKYFDFFTQKIYVWESEKLDMKAALYEAFVLIEHPEILEPEPDETAMLIMAGLEPNYEQEVLKVKENSPMLFNVCTNDNVCGMILCKPLEEI